MPRNPFALITAVVSIAAFATGCGDDAEPAGGGGAGGTDAPQNVQQAVDACKQQIDAQPQVSEDVKTDLKEVCEKAGSGDEAEAKAASREVCTRLIEESVPEGPARDQAIETCKTATE